MRRLQGFVRSLRPAVLASLVGRVSGLSRRRKLQTADGTFWINPISDLGWSLANGGYESGMKVVLEQYLKPGCTFIDLGANEGYFSVIASRLVGPRGTVISVEPQSRLQAVVQTNLSLNHCDNVRIIKAAVTSRSEPVTFELTPDVNTGGSSLFRSTKYACRQEVVDGLTLADFIQRTGIEYCDLMKVDIEGAEYDAFMGSGDTLEKGIIRNISLELHPAILKKRGLSAGDLHQRILAAGYTLHSELGNWVYTFEGTSASSASPFTSLLHGRFPNVLE